MIKLKQIKKRCAKKRTKTKKYPPGIPGCAEKRTKTKKGRY